MAEIKRRTIVRLELILQELNANLAEVEKEGTDLYLYADLSVVYHQISDAKAILDELVQLQEEKLKANEEDPLQPEPAPPVTTAQMADVLEVFKS